MTPYHREVAEHNAKLQAEIELQPTYYEPPWPPSEQEAATAREMADQARARQQQAEREPEAGA